MSLTEARERILARAEPGEAIESSLGEAVGLILAEPVIADVDQPPFDRATGAGFAVRAAEALPGALLRVAEPSRSSRFGDPAIEPGEAARVRPGDPMPPGADAVVRLIEVRPDPETGPTRVIEILQSPRATAGVTPRGAYLAAGTTLVPAGTRLRPALVPSLAAQGCVAPYCHRRVRVSIVTVGDQWVSPAEAPTMNRERNAANATLAALIVAHEAMPHDFQAVAGSKVRTTLERATTAPVVIVLGACSPTLARAWKGIGVEPVVSGIAVEAIGPARHGVIRDDDGQVLNHLFHLPADPVAASVGFLLLVQPLIARLQGETAEPTLATRILAAGQAHPSTRRRCRVRPAATRLAGDGRLVAEAIPGPLADLTAWSRADGFLLFPAAAGPWQAGDPVPFLPLRSLA